jgi:hypothetical protein
VRSEKYGLSEDPNIWWSGSEILGLGVIDGNHHTPGLPESRTTSRLVYTTYNDGD